MISPKVAFCTAGPGCEIKVIIYIGEYHGFSVPQAIDIALRYELGANKMC